MLVENEISKQYLHVKYKYDDFIFEPMVDIERIYIMKELLGMVEKKQKEKTILYFLYNLESLNKKDPIIPDKYYDSYKIRLSNARLLNDKFNIVTYVKNHKIYFIYSDIKYNLTMNNYRRIKKRFHLEDTKLMNEIIFVLLNRYNFLNLLNSSSGSIHPKHYKLIKNELNCQVEGFSSFYNCNLKYYCGLFPDLEKHFGCLGNFFNTQFISGYAVFNPPFYVDFMNRFFKRIVNQTITSIIIVPVFHTEDRKKLNKICKIKQVTNYKDDFEIGTIRKSNRTKINYLYCKGNFIYHDFLKDKAIHFTSTNLLVLNDKSNYDYKKLFGRPDIIE